MKLLFVSPTYGPVDPRAVKSQRAAIMHAAQHGVTWVGDASPDRMKFDAARNVAVELALQSDAEAIFWCDSDIVLPVDAISLLAGTGEPFITGIYCQRHPPHWPLITHFFEDKQTFSWFTDWPENVVAPIDGCGFGCVLTATAILKQMTPPYFAFEKYSEDFDFCLKARALGVNLKVHTGVLCGHLGDATPITASEFQAVRDRGDLERYLPHRSSAA